MPNGQFIVPAIKNEPVLDYSPHSVERTELKEMLRQLKSSAIEIPMVIGGQKITTTDRVVLRPPHELSHTLGHWHRGDESHIRQAIDAALAASIPWSRLSWEHRATIFLKAADLLAGPYRARINAASMLGQSKNAYQAEIDAACEMIDFLRFNVLFMVQIYADQPISSPSTWNRTEYRPLEGFIYAVTPFNFTSIAGNLPASAAMMGNVVVWKPSDKQIYSAHVLMEVFQQAGLPDGVINMVFCDAERATSVVLAHRKFAGIHFTGSTSVFKRIWKTIGQQIELYQNYPRLVGETGGKDFMLIHQSADVHIAAAALLRGAFEYQGQKCSAASRAYISASVWPGLRPLLQEGVASMNVGSPENFENFINAVIDERAFETLRGVIERAKAHPEAELLAGGGYDKSTGYFIHPTIILTTNPTYETMIQELFGPILTVYVYQDSQWQQTLDLIDQSTDYALTGGLIASDRAVIAQVEERLSYSAGNFYINDKCTGAVVGQQPFGGARASGTNDKAGSALNLLRWVSSRSIKENLLPPTHYTYPFLQAE